MTNIKWLYCFVFLFVFYTIVKRNTIKYNCKMYIYSILKLRLFERASLIYLEANVNQHGSKTKVYCG